MDKLVLNQIGFSQVHSYESITKIAKENFDLTLAYASRPDHPSQLRFKRFTKN